MQGEVGLGVALILFLLGLDKFSIVIVLALLIFTWNNWKCPNCNQYFGKGGNPKVYLNCVVKLVEK